MLQYISCYFPECRVCWQAHCSRSESVLDRKYAYWVATCAAFHLHCVLIFWGGPFNLILYVGLAALSALSERNAYIGGLMIIAAVEVNQGRFQPVRPHWNASRVSLFPSLQSVISRWVTVKNVRHYMHMHTVKKKYSENNGRVDGTKHKWTNTAKSSTTEIKKP